MKFKNKPIIVAEIGQSHHGNFENLKKIIIKICQTKVDAIKLQTHIADEESTLDEPFRSKKNIKSNFKSRFDYWKSMEFSLKEWKSISKIIKKKKKIFISSPFSIAGIKILLDSKVQAIKIGSGEFFSHDLLKQAVSTKLPIIVSTGMSTKNEVRKLISFLKKKKSKFCILQCHSSYPTKFKDVGINLINKWKKTFKCPIGISIHNKSTSPALAAIANDANLIEVHVEIKTDKYNPDSTSSLSIEQLNQICNFRDDYYVMKNSKYDKKKLSLMQQKLKKIFTKSLALKTKKKKGHVVKKVDLTTKKPGTGINISKINDIIGRKLKYDVPHNILLKYKHLEKK